MLTLRCLLLSPGEIDFTNFTALVSGSREDDGTSFESPLARRKPKVRTAARRR